MINNMKTICYSFLFLIAALPISAQVNRSFSKNNFTPINQPLNSIVAGAILHLDAGNSGSYIGSGTNWTDISGNGNNMTLPATLASSFTNTNGGSFLYGQTSTHSITNSALTNFGFANNAITIEVWFKKVATGDYQFWFSDNTANFRFGINSSGNYFWNMGTRYDRVNSSYTLPTGVWKHIVVTGGIEGSTIVTRFYLDGALLFYFNEGYSNLRSISTVLIGCGEGVGNYLLKGNLAVCRVYQKALIADEVLQNYNASKSKFGL